MYYDLGYNASYPNERLADYAGRQVLGVNSLTNYVKNGNFAPKMRNVPAADYFHSAHPGIKENSPKKVIKMVIAAFGVYASVVGLCCFRGKILNFFKKFKSPKTGKAAQSGKRTFTLNHPTGKHVYHRSKSVVNPTPAPTPSANDLLRLSAPAIPVEGTIWPSD